MFDTGVAQADVVRVIVVRGNARVETATIKNYVVIKPGVSYAASAIDESVKLLFDTGLFADVTIVRSGSSLVVTVVENPIVNTVIFTGNKKVKGNILVTLVSTSARGVLTDAKLQADAQRIEDYYAVQGRSGAVVDPQVTPLPNNRVDVVFAITEGKRTGIGTIAFVGNSAYSDYRLRSVIISRQHNILSWLNKKDVFDEAKLAADQEALRRFYMSHGYADFRVLSVDTQFNDEKGRYYITITVEEGPRYRFGGVEIDSTMPGVDVARLKRAIKTRPGQIFNATLVEKSIENLAIELSREGFSFAQVRPRGDRDYEKNTITITYMIDEGGRIYIERINIFGNTKTRDYVIRREFEVSEGDPYNRVMIDRAERKLRDLGYFKTVVITTEPGSAPDRVIINVMVEDQSTGDFSIGAGYSTDGLIGEISLNEKNFLGRGQQLRISYGYGEHQQTYSLSFYDPFFLGTRIGAGFDLYNTDSQKVGSFRPYDSTVTGGGVKFGFPITDEFTAQLNYKVFQTTVTNTIPWTAAFFPNGERLTSSVGYSLIYSTIDNAMDPRNGLHVNFSQDFAGVGGDAQYLRSTVDARYFQELLSEADIVGMLRVAGGNITGLGKPVSAVDNFFKGGETVRGFESFGYGPRTAAAADGTPGVPVGGKNFWVATAEVQFPIPGVPPDFGLKGAAFVDAGGLFGVDLPTGPAPAVVANDGTIRSSVGASILWNSPLGLLRGDFAWALTKAAQDKTQIFRFSAGKTF